MATAETVVWWRHRGKFGAYVRVEQDGVLMAEVNRPPSGAPEITEQEFATLLRNQFITASDAHEARRISAESSVAQAQSDRKKALKDLVSSGVSKATAEMIIPAAPISPVPDSLVPPAGAGERLRSLYRLSQESIDYILAPI